MRSLRHLLKRPHSNVYTKARGFVSSLLFTVLISRLRDPAETGEDELRYKRGGSKAVAIVC